MLRTFIILALLSLLIWALDARNQQLVCLAKGKQDCTPKTLVETGEQLWEMIK